MDQQMARIADDFGDEFVLQAQTIEEICFGEDGVLHVFQGGILEQQAFEHLFLNRPNNQQIDLALGLGKGTGKKNELHTGKLLERLDEWTLGLDVLTKDTLELFKERELGIDMVVLLTITMAGLHEANATKIFEFAADAVDLFSEQTRELTNEKLLLRMQQERTEKLDSRLRTKQCFEDRRRHVQKQYSLTLG